MNNIDLLEWLGYLASILILISLLMSSIVKLRWINLVGATLFTAYGFSINALPVAIVNLAITFINIYYLFKIYSTKEYFKILEMNPSDKYLGYFLDYYKNDISKFFPSTSIRVSENTVGFYILRNLVPAGIFLATPYGAKALLIDVDFVIPEYRDFKLGRYIYSEQKDYFIKLGYEKLCALSTNQNHRDYLLKMGFIEDKLNGESILVKSLV